MNETRNRTQPQYPSKWSISQLAGLLQRDRRTLSEKLVTLRVPFEDGPKNAKLYVLEDVLKALYTKNNTNENGQPVDDSVSALDQERMLLTKAKREKAELELAVSRQEFVPVSEVVDNVSKEYGLVRTALRAMPAALSKHVANLNNPEEIFNILSSSIENVLSELTGDAENKIKEIASQNETGQNDNESTPASETEVDTDDLIEDEPKDV